MVKKLLHTRYRVHDLDKTISFYKDVLGLKEVRRHTSGRGSQLVFLKAPGSDEEIEICKFDRSGPIVVGPDLTHLAFEVDDLDKFAQHAAAKGYPLSDGPTAEELLSLTRRKATKSNSSSAVRNNILLQSCRRLRQTPLKSHFIKGRLSNRVQDRNANAAQALARATVLSIIFRP
jgi:lactoylglutathione lyase